MLLKKNSIYNEKIDYLICKNLIKSLPSSFDEYHLRDVFHLKKEPIEYFEKDIIEIKTFLENHNLINIDIKESEEEILKMLDSTSLDIVYKNGEQRMMLDGNDVSDFIRTPSVSLGASAISAIPGVRMWLLDLQRNLAANNNCLMDGRDIGTSVLPDANVKIFLTASPEARAKRRYDELLEKGENVTFEEVFNDMITRDKNDSTRKCSPLKKADDAVVVDTSELNFEESVMAIKAVIAEKDGK